MNAAVAVVQGRIAEIQRRFTPVAVPGRFEAALAREMTGVTAAGTTTPVTGTKGAAVVEAAKKYLGVPYRWGGTDPRTGLDCSGLVQLVYRQFGVELPRVSRDQARAGTPVPSLAQARPGDLVAFGSPVDHIGIYMGDGKMVVAPHSGAHVRVEDIGRRTPTAIRRVLPDESAMASIAGLDRPAALSPGAAPYRALFEAATARHGLPAGLLEAVAKAESGFNPTARSHAGALGLMQIMPATAQGLGVDPLDPAQAVDGAARLLSGHLSRFGSVELALAAYNAGPGAVTRHGGVPPYAETQAYVRKVMAEL